MPHFTHEKTELEKWSRSYWRSRSNWGLNARFTPNARSLEHCGFFWHSPTAECCPVRVRSCLSVGVRPQGKGYTVVPEALVSAVEDTRRALSETFLVLLRECLFMSGVGGGRTPGQKGPGFLMFESHFGLSARDCHWIWWKRKDLCSCWSDRVSCQPCRVTAAFVFVIEDVPQR